jgi:hypothetical protein
MSTTPYTKSIHQGISDEDIFLHYYPLAKMQQNGLNGPFVDGKRPCEPHNPTLLSLGGGSHLKRESQPSPTRLIFWGDWAFPWVGAPEYDAMITEEYGAKIAKAQQEALVAL